MKIIENKKIFGKFNIIDILIVCIFAIGLIFSYKYFAKQNTIVDKTINWSYQIEIQNLPKGTNLNIKVGDKIYDNEKNQFMGTVESFEVLPNTKVIENFENNSFEVAVDDNKENIKINLKAAVLNGADIKTSEDYVIKVGKQVFARGPSYAGRGFLTYIERGVK